MKKIILALALGGLAASFMPADSYADQGNKCWCTHAVYQDPPAVPRWKFHEWFDKGDTKEDTSVPAPFPYNCNATAARYKQANCPRNDRRRKDCQCKEVAPGVDPNKVAADQMFTPVEGTNSELNQIFYGTSLK